MTKGGISISKDLIPDEVKPGDIIMLKVADVDPDKGEVHFEYLNKQSNGTENSPETSGVNENENENETEKTSPLLQ
jgi:transcriptional accessory protein Tex/SPT6